MGTRADHRRRRRHDRSSTDAAGSMTIAGAGRAVGDADDDDDDEMTTSSCRPLVKIVAVIIVGGIVLVGAYWLYTTRRNASVTTAPSSGGRGGGGGGGGGATSSSSTRSVGSSAGATGGDSSPTSSEGERQGTATSSASSTATAGSPESTGGGGRGDAGSSRVVSFFENWKGIDPSTVNFDGLYAAFWFTAVPDAKGSVDLHEGSSGQAKSFAEAAKKAGTKPILTVGGWEGSKPFSNLVAKEDSRNAFVDDMVKLMEDNSFEGLDIDWEYPGALGASEEFDVENDLANLLLLLQAIRDKIGDDKILSIDTSSPVYIGSDGNPATDLSEFGKVLSFLTVMTYDATMYSSKTTGPNFAYSSKCAQETFTYEVPTTIQAWIDAKFPADKISLGLASYGYKWEVSDFKDGGGVDGTSSSIYQKASKVLSAGDGSASFGEIVTTVSRGFPLSFVFPFPIDFSLPLPHNNNKSKQYLDKMQYTYDECTSTPFLYSKDTKLFIAYDDEKSFAKKGGYAKEHGNCSVYAGLTQDDKDRKLTKAALAAC
ncbi:hypothetical protein JCM11491_000386 [Sporobolomyces phaffii]